MTDFNKGHDIFESRNFPCATLLEHLADQNPKVLLKINRHTADVIGVKCSYIEKRPDPQIKGNCTLAKNMGRCYLLDDYVTGSDCD